MGRPPRAPPDLAAHRVEANGERVLRSRTVRIGCPNAKKASEKKESRDKLNRRGLQLIEIKRGGKRLQWSRGN
jgi:hypothetical protein